MLFTEIASHSDEAELRALAGLLAWRRCEQEAVVPVPAMIEPPAAIPDFVLIERHPLIED